MFYATTALSAGFNCEKAKAPAEKLICQDSYESREIFNLDGLLNDIYSRVIHDAVDPKYK